MSSPIAIDLANRIQKNQRRLKKFIKNGQTNAYRIYDADIPEYAIAVDIYDDWLHIQEYAPPKNIPPDIAQQRLEQSIHTCSKILNTPLEKIALKQRKQQKGIEQYEKQNRIGHKFPVYENNIQFHVNMTDYLDTGLFLDHRPMRFWLQQSSKGKKVLNLFCYIATASVHAAYGGANQVDSLDMSATYLNWGKENFLLNKINPEKSRYQFIQTDVLQWLTTAPTTSKYDLIFLDPPTFSNSKRMRDTFDIQREHVDLISKCMNLLENNGILMFSTNYRKFKLDPYISIKYQVTDTHKQSLPEDFQRNHKIHYC